MIEESNNIASPEQYQKSGFCLSSWNYGSFYHCNPYHLQKEFLKPNKENTEKNAERSSSVNMNKYGKVALKPEEKIVSEEMLRTLKGLKTIKNDNQMKRNKTAKNLRTNTLGTNDLKSNTGDNNYSNSKTVISKNESENKKNFKYQLNYEEWLAIKKKQDEILSKWESENKKENKNIEIINVKINEEYDQIKNETYAKWLDRKKQEKMRKKEIEKRRNDEKNKIHEEKEYVNNSKMEEWFKRQASKLEQEAYVKKVKSQIVKEEKLRQEEEINQKKLKSVEAYSNWLKKKEMEKDKNVITSSSKNNNEKRRKQNDIYSTSKDQDNKMNNNFKISIGPYSTGKALRNIEKKLTYDFQVNSYYDHQEKDKKTTKKKIDDSFQDLSSIKKDTPENENVGDDYE